MNVHGWFPWLLLFNHVGFDTTWALTYPTLTELCPARTFCHSNATQVINGDGLESCCQACSCEADCYIIGNCCPDADIPDKVGGNSTRPVPQCISMGNNLNAHRLQNVIWQHGSFYNIISTCPSLPDVQDEVVALCHSPVALLDHTPVSSRDGHQLYRNQHCAQCNGEVDIVPWNLYTLECDAILDGFTSIEDAGSKLETCVLMAKSPGYQYVRNTHCPSNVINVCNATGLWDEYDADIEEKCLTDAPARNTFYTAFMFAMYYSFDNIYCFYCNTKFDSITPKQECQKHQDGQTKDPGRVPFLLLLSADGSGTRQAIETRVTSCMTSGEVYDRFLDKCHQVVCSLGMVPMDGSCTAVGYSYGIGVLMVLAIRSVSAVGANSTTLPPGRHIDKGEEATVAVNAFFAFLKNGFIPNCPYKACEASLGEVEHENNDEFFQSTIVSAFSCPFHKMIHGLSAFVDKDIEFEFETDNVTKKVVLALDFDRNDSSAMNEIWGYVSDDTCTGTWLTRDLLVTCPRIRLNVTELREELANVTVSRLIDARIETGMSSTLTDGTFDICLADYHSIMPNAACPLWNLSLLLWSMVSLLLSMFFLSSY